MYNGSLVQFIIKSGDCCLTLQEKSLKINGEWKVRNRVNEWRMINPKDNDDVFPPKTSFCQTLNSGLLLLQYMVPVLISAVYNVYNQFTGQL